MRQPPFAPGPVRRETMMVPSTPGRRIARATGRVGVKTVRAGYQRRGTLWPLFIAAGLAIASTGLHLTGEDGWRAALTIAVLLAVFLGVRQRKDAKLGAPWRMSTLCSSWIALAAAAGWSAVAAMIGPWTIPMPGLLAVGVLAGQAALWWHRQHQPAPVVDEEPVEVDCEFDERIYTWVTKIAKSDGALPESHLEHMKDLPKGLGWSADIQLPKGGTQTTGEAVAAVRRIASAYDVPVEQVVIEPSVDGLMSRARLLVLTRNPLQPKQVFKGLTWNPETGYFRLGVHADGSDALYRLWTPGSGANHGMIAGTTGAGKSGFVNQICTEVRHSGKAILCFGDPEDGESAPDWQDEGPHVFAGTVPKIRRMLQAVERVMDDRKKRRRSTTWVDEQGRTRRGKGFFDPTPEEPLIVVVIDEAPDVTNDPECARIIAKIGKKGRKVGVGAHLVVQIPSLAELGGNLAIRSMLSSTNVVIFRTADKHSKNMGVPMDLPIDPNNLPTKWPDGSTTAGLGFLATAGGRVSPMRATYVEDPYHWATTGKPARIPDADIAAAKDEKGNYFLEWRELRDVDDDEDDVLPSPQAAPSGNTASTRSRIVEFLRDRGEPAHTGVIADALGLSKPATSMALKRLKKDGEAVDPKHGVWTLVGSGMPEEGAA